MNVSGIAKDALRRGMVLTTPRWLKPASALDVQLRAVRDLARPIRHNMKVTFHSGADEANAQIRLLDADQLDGGDVAWAQIRLETPVAVVRGDRFVGISIIRRLLRRLNSGVRCLLGEQKQVCAASSLLRCSRVSRGHLLHPLGS